MTNLTIKQLRYVEALAKHGHFGRAAEACAISQPALSMQIRQLEDVLGLALFERGGRDIRLTGFGGTFVARARDILRSVDDLGDLARAATKGLSGELRLGVIPTVAPYLLPQLLGRLRETHGELDVHVRETVTPRLILELTDGQLDAAVVALPVSEPALEEVALFEEPFVLVRATHAADDPVPDSERLRDMRLLLLEEGHCFR
ncbi:MAG: LysR substrate-binding domain-containing protein, partial [Pseudomonadota bacterium]